MNTFIQFVKKHITPDDSLVDGLNEIMTEMNVPSGGILSNQNTYCRHLYFIKKGLVKFCFDSNGKEFIMRFFEEGILFTDIEGWNKKERSRYNIVALEDTEFILIPLSSFEFLCQHHHTLEVFYRKLMTRASLNMMERIKEILEEDAKKRYSNFVENHPNLLRRISLGDLSKYLGITQVSLSRIRASK